MGFVFVESGGEVPTSLSNVHFASCAGNLVYSRSGIRILPVLVGLDEVANLVWCRVEYLDVVLGEGPLDPVRGAAQVWEGYRRRFLAGLNLGIGDLLVLMCSGVFLSARVAISQQGRLDVPNLLV